MPGHTTAWQRLPGSGRRVKQRGSILRENEHHRLKNAANTLQSVDLLDALSDFLELKNDAGLARELQLYPPIISKIRHGKSPISAAVLISMHELSGISIVQLRAHMGDHRRRFGMPDEQERR